MKREGCYAQLTPRAKARGGKNLVICCCGRWPLISASGLRVRA